MDVQNPRFSEPLREDFPPVSVERPFVRASLRFAAPDDLDALIALEEAFPAKERWSRDTWFHELEADNRWVQVAEDPGTGEVLGVITVQIIGGVADLNRIIVAPEARGHGVGAELLRAGVEDANAAEADEMLLEVRHDNRAAHALYARAGFTEIARRTDYYGAGVDAVVLRLELAEEDDDDEN